MKVIPLHLRQANEFVSRLHRHNKPVVGYKFAVGAELDGKIVGVAIAGRPIARLKDDGTTLEVLRVCTDGTMHANSFLYGAVKRIATAMGYQRVLTYTLQTESGSSLRAVGAISTPIRGSSWSRKSRPRVEQAVFRQDKLLWIL